MPSSRFNLLLTTCLCCAAAAASAEPWMSPEHRKEFSYLAEQKKFTAEKWAELRPEAGEELLRDAAEPADARYAEVLASYKELAAKWNAQTAEPGLRAIDARKLAEIRLWLGAEGADYLAAKKNSVGALLSKLAAGAALAPADTAAADAYLTPEFSGQVKGAAKFRADAALAAPKPKNKKATFSGADKIKGSPGGGVAALNKMYDGGGAAAEASAVPGAVKVGNPSAALKSAARNPTSLTIDTKQVPAVSAGPDKAAKPIPADYAAMSPEAKRIYQVHAAVVEKYKGLSLGAGTARGTLGNVSGFDRQECNGDKDNSIHCLYAKTIAGAAGWYAQKLPIDRNKGMQNQGVPTAGVKVAPVSLESGEYMRCYDWANAVNATADGAGLSPQFKKQEVTNSGFLGMGEHHYMVFIGQGKIYISDPWKNGATLMAVPDTPANRKKWVDR